MLVGQLWLDSREFGPGKSPGPRTTWTDSKNWRRGCATRPASPPRTNGGHRLARGPSHWRLTGDRTRAPGQALPRHVRLRPSPPQFFLHGDGHLAPRRAAGRSPRAQLRPARPSLSPAWRGARRPSLPDPVRLGCGGGLLRFGSRRRRARVGRPRRRLRPRRGHRRCRPADGPVGPHRGTPASSWPEPIAGGCLSCPVLKPSRAQGVAVVALLRHFGCFCW